jgi:hypothetical protein
LKGKERIYEQIGHRTEAKEGNFEKILRKIKRDNCLLRRIFGEKKKKLKGVAKSKPVIL